MKRKKRQLLNIISFFGVLMAICIMTIGYSAFDSKLNISGEAIVKVDNIKIVDLNITSYENEAYERYNSSYQLDTIDYHIILPNPDSSITYKVDIKNLSDRDYGIAFINGLPDNLTYELQNYKLGDKLCTGTVCNNGEIDELYLTIKYKDDGYNADNTNFSGRMKIDFEHFCNVFYNNVDNSSSLKSVVLRKTTYEENISVPEGKKLKIRMNGVILAKDSNFTYDSTLNKLIIPNVSSNIVISIEDIGTEFDTSNTGLERKFEFANVDYNINNKTFFLEVDLSQINLKKVFENIISIGNDIKGWSPSYSMPTGVNLHLYYPAAVDTNSVSVDLTYMTENSTNRYGKFQKNINVTSANLMRLAFNDNGLYINGEMIFNKTGKGKNVTTTITNLSTFLQEYFNFWETNGLNVSIGSLEGSTRSNAIYNEIKIYDELLSESELINKTKIRKEEIPFLDETPYKTVSSAIINGTQHVSLSYPFKPNNNKFIFSKPDFVDLNSNSLFLEMDVSNLKEGAKLENLIGVGNDFTDWIAANVYDLYLFYPSEVNNNEMIISLLNSTTYKGQFRGNVSLIDDKLIKVLFSSRGLYINGEKWLSSEGQTKSGLSLFGNNAQASTVVSEFFKKFTFPNDNNINFLYGSEQGDNRSTATYNDIRVYNGSLTESESISITS